MNSRLDTINILPFVAYEQNPIPNKISRIQRSTYANSILSVNSTKSSGLTLSLEKMNRWMPYVTFCSYRIEVK